MSYKINISFQNKTIGFLTLANVKNAGQYGDLSFQGKEGAEEFGFIALRLPRIQRGNLRQGNFDTPIQQGWDSATWYDLLVALDKLPQDWSYQIVSAPPNGEYKDNIPYPKKS